MRIAAAICFRGVLILIAMSVSILGFLLKGGFSLLSSIGTTIQNVWSNELSLRWELEWQSDRREAGRSAPESAKRLLWNEAGVSCLLL
jgi:hypothetical protein